MGTPPPPPGPGAKKLEVDFLGKFLTARNSNSCYSDLLVIIMHILHKIEVDVRAAHEELLASLLREFPRKSP
jgi:hypothetical protein